MTSHVEAEVQRRIAAARAKAEADRKRREEFAAARAAGLVRRHRQKLARLAEKGLDLAPPTLFDNQTLSASGC
ncbi:hypothetical protein [Streptomyces sp. IBSBF 2806]|uniref:hypothetical protein n=1 Tax=Streptomyces sp. IBSBF 2806 TaxID=2903529 RepID=UPI002FDC5C7B